jgi:hypothetical protein
MPGAHSLLILFQVNYIETILVNYRETLHQGNQRLAHHIIITALRLATDKNVNHLSDAIINEAITVLKQG